MTTASMFSDDQQETLAALCRELTARMGVPVHIAYGSDDSDQFHDAALCVAELPPGAYGHPGVLASIVTGPGVGRDGFAAMAANGDFFLDGVGFSRAAKAAGRAGERECKRLMRGALKQ